MVIKNPFRRDEDQPFANLQRYALGANADQQKPAQPAQTQQPAQYAQAATLAQPQTQQTQSPQPAPQPAAPAPQPQVPPPVVPPAPQAQQFGQPQQPQPAQPRQTTMTPTTAAQRYNQMLQQNVPQAQAVSSGLAQVIENPTVEAQRGFDAAQKEFQDKVRESGLTRNIGRTSDLINKAANLKAGETLTPEEFAELQKISSTKNTFGEGVRDTDFVALQNYVNALGQADQAKQMAALAGDQTGRQELLSKLVDNQQQYGAGQSLFDSLLAGGVRPAAEQLSSIKDQLVTQDVLGKAGSAAQTRAADVRNLEQEEINKSYQDIVDFLDSKETGKLAAQEQAIRDRVVAENKRVQELNAKIDSVLKNKGSKFGDNQAEQDLIAELGLNPTIVEQIEMAGPNARADIINRLKELNEQTATSKDELARLNQMYKIGELVNRQGNKIQAQEGADLGSLIDQKAGVNRSALDAAVSENTRAADARKAEIQQSVLQSPIQDYRFGNGTTTKNAAIDIYDRLRTGSFRPDIDNPEADKVVKNLKSAVNETVEAYKAAGLPFTPPQEPSTADVLSTFKDMWDNSPIAKIPVTNKPMYNGNIDELKAKNPELYNQMYESALRMAQIKKLSEYMGFFNEF